MHLHIGIDENKCNPLICFLIGRNQKETIYTFSKFKEYFDLKLKKKEIPYEHDDIRKIYFIKVHSSMSHTEKDVDRFLNTTQLNKFLFMKRRQQSIIICACSDGMIYKEDTLKACNQYGYMVHTFHSSNNKHNLICRIEKKQTNICNLPSNKDIKVKIVLDNMISSLNMEIHETISKIYDERNTESIFKLKTYATTNNMEITNMIHKIENLMMTYKSTVSSINTKKKIGNINSILGEQ